MIFLSTFALTNSSSAGRNVFISRSSSGENMGSWTGSLLWSWIVVTMGFKTGMLVSPSGGAGRWD